MFLLWCACFTSLPERACAQSASIPNTAAMGEALSASISGTYTSPPNNLVSTTQTGGMVTGNGDMAIIVGGAASELQFYVGKADFFGVLKGAIQPVGTLNLSVPALSGSSYSLKENIGPATVTGAFANGSYGLAMSSWVASSENTAVIQLTNTGSQPLSLSSTLTEGFEGTTGNQATHGATNNSTWLSVSPDTVNIELGNHFYVQSNAPFTGAIADFKLFTNVLSPSTLASIDASNAPTPLLQWQATNNGTAALAGTGVSINTGDVHGGSLQCSGGNGELLLGDMPFPERQFTVSTWVIATANGENSCLVAAQIPLNYPYGPSYPYPFARGLSLNLVNGALSATLNVSGSYNASTDEFVADAVNKFTTTASSALPYGTWVEVAVTYDGNVLSIYTNGVEVGSTASFPTGYNGLMGWNKMANHIGDTNVIYNGCAPNGVLMQSVLGATATTNSTGGLSFTIPAGGQASLVLAAVTDRNNTNYFAAAQQQSQQATTNSLATLWQGHQGYWTNFWSKSFVQIPDQTIQNQWYAGLYLLAIGSGTNSPPPGLYGNLVTANQTSWDGDYTLDYNFECPPLASMPNNHMEMTESYPQPLLDQISRGEAIAQSFLGMTNSIYFYCHLIPAPGWSDDLFAVEDIKYNAVFAAVDIAQRWKYTLDTNYAARVYPYLKGVANFWDNYLVLTNGVYMDYNDAAQEFTSATDINPAMTLAYLQLLYPTVLQMSEALNVDATNRPLWTNIIANLAPQTIVPASSISQLAALGAPYDSSGINVIRETASGTAFGNAEVLNYSNQQITGSGSGESSAQAIVPGWAFGLESPSYSLHAASNTVWLMAAWYDFNANVFSYTAAADVGYDPNAILTNLHNFLTDYSLPNFIIDVSQSGVHGCWAEQAATVPSALPAMFLQSYQTNMHVFPDWPTNQSASFGNLNACGGFLVSSAITLGKPDYIQIQSTAGQMLKLVNPWTNSSVQCVSSINGNTNLSGNILNYQTQIGEVLTLTTTNPALNAPTNVTSSTNSGLVVLSWNPVSGADGYNIKRSTSYNGPFVTLASITSGTSYSDASASYNTTYYYQITALEPGYESTNPSTLTVTTGGKPPILNASFEAQSVAQGNYLIGDPTDWNSSLLSGTADAVISPGGSGTAEPWPSLPVPGVDGNNYCQIYASSAGGGGTIYQDTGIKYVAGTSYNLTAAIGLQNNQSFDTGSSFGFYNSSLTPVAATTITTNQLSVGSFTNVSVSYTGTGNEGGNGDIIIGFNAPSAAVSSSYFDFDNVSLVVSNPVPPSITSEPVSKTTNAGSTVAFTVAATGTAPLSYQWYANTNTPLSGATNAALTLSNVLSSATYYVVVSNAYGSVTSSIAGLTVIPGQQTLLDVQFGNTATQSGAAVLGSSGDIWNSITVSTGNLVSSAGYAFTGIGLSLSTQGIFTDSNGSAMDTATTALMEKYAYAYSGPANVAVNLTGLSQYEGDTFTLVVYAAGDTSGQGASLKLTGAAGGNSASTLSTSATSRKISQGNGVAYQTFTGTLTNNTLSITASIPAGGTYAIANGFQLQLTSQAPTITTEPFTQATNAGGSVTYSVAATGTGSLSYQWYAGTNTPIIGATNSSLSLTNVQTNGTYDVVVSNPYGSITSSIAKLTLVPNAPASLSATTTTKSVTLTYASVSGAKFYTIYRSKISGGPYTKIATTSATKYTDLNVIAGTTYYYVVADTDGINLSAYSPQTSATPR